MSVTKRALPRIACLASVGALALCLASGCAEPREPAVGAERRVLNEGYSMLYADALSMERSELILYAKFETDELEAVVHEVAEFGGKLRTDLERMAEAYPALRLDLEPLPEMETRKRRAIGMDRASDFAPLVGRSGRAYERTVLIGFANGINHERHLCEVMASAETDPALRKFLRETERGYGRLYDRANALLEREHFADPDGKSVVHDAPEAAR